MRNHSTKRGVALMLLAIALLPALGHFAAGPTNSALTLVVAAELLLVCIGFWSTCDGSRR